MTIDAAPPLPDGGPPAGDATASVLTAKEQALWLFLQDAAHSGVLNVPFAVRLADRVRWWPMNETLMHLIRRHPALRTLFPAPDGVPTRQVLDPADPVAARPPLHVRATTDHRLDADLKRFAAQPFDLARELPFRVGQFVCEQGDVLCVVVSHLVYDAYSARVLVKELFELYDTYAAGTAVPDLLAGQVLPPPAGRPGEDSMRYWRDHLAGAQSGRGDLLIGASESRSPEFPGADVTVTMDAASTAALADLAERLSLTPSIVALGAFNLLLSQHGMGEDVVIGMPVSARGGRPHGAIGYHVNIIALRTRLSADASFHEYLRHTREVFLNGLLHSQVSLDEIRPGSYDDDAAGGRPLFRHMFNYVADLASSWETPSGRRLRYHAVPTSHSRLDLEMGITAVEEGLAIRLAYATDLFTADEATALLDRYQHILCECAARPDVPVRELDLWTARDRRISTAAPAATPVDAFVGSGYDLVAAWAERTPTADALVDAQRRLSFHELLVAARGRATELRATGVRAGGSVTVAARGIDTLVTALGAWSCGAAVVPSGSNGA
ncbi:MAG TPA: condensation domain-containing protein, partial [Micromonosporaceae bacterium]|nr:condensation domain-containing protein [Micromonosporaceae bacterium]